MELLQKHFDTALESPDGIKKLRELILTLAMQGKLVKQDTKDQPASELLEEIQAEKERLIKEGKIKNQKELPDIKPEEVPYQVPSGWEWTRLGEIASYNGRDNAKPNEISNDMWVLDLEDIEKDTSRIIYRAKYSERQSKSNKSLFQKGDVLYGKLRPYLNKVVVADSDGVCTTEIVPIVPTFAINSEFLLWLIKRPAFISHVNALSYGVKMPRLGTDDAVNSIHPLPPLTEQKRIVAKIDELMALCDKLEAQRNARNDKRLAVHTAVINRLLTASGKSDFYSAWKFITRHFDPLYSVKENVAELKKAILTLAMRGKLVKQDPKDQPASELLKEIQAAKERLVKEGKIKQQKELPPIKPDEVPYAVPEGWEWVRLGELCEINGGFAFKSNAYTSEGIRVIRISDFDENGFKNDKIVRHPFSDKLRDFQLKENNILMAMTGGTVGKSFLVDKLSEVMLVNQRVATIRILDRILPRFLYSHLKTDIVQNVIQNAKNSTNDNISMADIQGFFIPLPSLAEQKRIIAKIDELMALCDKLEIQIEQATTKQTALFDAVLAKV